MRGVRHASRGFEIVVMNITYHTFKINYFSIALTSRSEEMTEEFILIHINNMVCVISVLFIYEYSIYSCFKLAFILYKFILV